MEKTTSLEDKDIPKSLTIGVYEYSFKQKKSNKNYAYRCRNRKCGVIISINENNLLKIIKNNIIEDIEYQIVSKKEHTCNKNTEIISNKFINTNSDMYQLAPDLIKNNIDKTLEWHEQNLKDNNITITKNQIKTILQKFRDINYPKNDLYLQDISKIRITFSKTNKSRKFKY